MEYPIIVIIWKQFEKSGANAVVIATPTKYHCEIAVAAAKRGLHIFCEKPMAMDTMNANK